MSEIKKIKVQGTTYDIGGSGGASDHRQLSNRDAANQHPMSAITGLENALDSKGTYSKPSGGIPKTDLASAVQTSLGKADSALQASALNPYRTASAQDVIDATKAAASDVSAIQAKIPSAATSANQLADKAFVNSTVSTNTAIFRGTFNSVAELEAYSGDKTNNDYAFVITTDSTGNTVYNRYKYNGTAWVFEYALNNSSFTAAQWAAIQSGITAEDVALIGTAVQPSDLADYALKTEDIPTKTSDLVNDSGFLDDTDTEEAETLGIDSVVTEDSTNLITSAAVFDVVGDIEAALEALL